MEKLHISFMKNLRNFEFGELFEAISNSIAKENIEIPAITNAWERLQPHSKELLKMNHVKLRHPLTKLIQKQVKTRTEYLICLRLTIESKTFSHRPEERTTAKLLQLWLETYSKDLYPPSILTQGRMVNNLMHDRKEKSEIMDATEMLDLDELLEAIVKLTAKIRRNYLKRMNEKDIYEVDGRGIRKAAFADLKVFINVLEATHSISTNEEQKEQLRTLNGKINENIKDTHTLFKSRTTKRKNKKEVVRAIKKLISSQEQPQKTLPMGVDDEVKMDTSTTLSDLTSTSSENKSLSHSNKRKPPSLTNDVKNLKSTSENISEDSSANNIDKRKKGGDWKVPPKSNS